MSRCSKGKSCKTACIEKSYHCDVQFAPRVASSISAVRDSVPKTEVSAPTAEAKKAMVAAKSFDKTFQPKEKIAGSQTSFDWTASTKDTEHAKKGAYGSVLILPDKVVKRGEVNENEARIIDTLGKADLGPKLIYAENGKGSRIDHGMSIVPGRIAMSRVPGKELSDFDNHRERVGNTTVGNAYWAARAQLHMLGIAHNDQHHGNVIIDGSGKARFVDLGLAKASPKAALAEAIGVFANRDDMPAGAMVTRPRPWGDFVTLKKIGGKIMFPSFGALEPRNEQPENLQRMRTNKVEVFKFLQAKGLSKDEIAEVVATGVRQSDKTFEQGPWGKLTNKDASDLINLLYKGVS